MALILNIETATDICSISLSKGQDIIGIKKATEAYQHASKITLLISACFEGTNYKLNDLDAIAISKGPGSYTALRIGTATAKGICYTLQKPLIAVDSLQALALATMDIDDQKALYIPMIDARRMEVYTAIFDNQNQEIIAPHAAVITDVHFLRIFK